MLKITEADGFAGVRTEGGTSVIDLTDHDGAERLTVAGPLLSPPKESIAWRDRRAMGRALRTLGHLLDAAAIGVPLLLSGFVSDNVVSKGVVTLFV